MLYKSVFKNCHALSIRDQEKTPEVVPGSLFFTIIDSHL